MATRQTPAYRVRFQYDEDAHFEECNGESRPLTEEEYAENAYMRDGQPIPYAEYLEYYGNPDRHVYLLAHAQKRCPCCGEWGSDAYLGGIDYMDDSPKLRVIDINQFIDPDGALALPGHLRECAAGVLQEAGWRPPMHVRCRVRGCTYWHVTADHFAQPGTDAPDVRYCASHQTPASRRRRSA